MTTQIIIKPFQDGINIVNKSEFLEIVKNFSRKDFYDYLNRNINKKQKLINVVIIVDDDSFNNKKNS